MNGFTSKTTGKWILAIGITGILAVITLFLFFVDLFQNIPSLSFMGGLNDTLNSLAGILSAVLASILHPTLRKLAPRLSQVLLIGVWVGAIAITFGSWLIMTGLIFFGTGIFYPFWCLRLGRWIHSRPF